MRKHLYTPILLFASVIVAVNAQAGSFVADFNSGTPTNATLYGAAVVSTNGGYGNTGCLKLTTAVANQSGSIVINDLDAGQPIASFIATFKALVGGGTGADGFSFNFASDIANGSFGEQGSGTGLTVAFDTYQNAGDNAPGVRVFVGGSLVADQAFASLRANQFVNVLVKLDPDGTLDVSYNGTTIVDNMGITLPSALGRFALGARTGGSFDNHFIDNLSITTTRTNMPFVESYSPVVAVVRPDASVNVVLKDSTTAVVTNSIQLLFDGTNVVSSSTIVQSSPTTTIAFDPPGLMAGNSSHTVTLIYADDATPTPNTNSFQWSFAVSSYSTLPTNLIAAPTMFDTNSPGFLVRFGQVTDNNQPGNLARAEQQLAGLIIDPNTSLPAVNSADPNIVTVPANLVGTNDAAYTYLETNVINYGYPQGQGNFTTDLVMPGLPGTSSDQHNYALDAVTYLHLTPGFYSLGVNSADGFRLTASANPDVFSPVEAVFDGPRVTPADSTVTFAVAQEGYYPFRLLYFVGQKAVFGVFSPGTDTPSLEFFSTDVNGVKTLINDTTAPGFVSACRPAATLPYVRSVNPSSGEAAVSRNESIDVVIVDGSITVQTNTIQLKLAGNDVTASSLITTNGLGITTIHYQPPTLLGVNSNYTVQVAFTDSASTRRTNSYQFTTENILSQLWIIPPNQTTNTTLAKWVTTGTTERGIAYNPKTGHVLLVSRAAATGADGPNGAGIAVLDGNTGLYIKQLDQGTGIIAGGTFKMNLIDVTDDGVIYMASLATSASSPFKIYRWQDENAQPTIAYSGFPVASAGTPRWGDSFCVRGSGAGTQIISSGNNSSVNTVPLFTTADGTNFTLTLITPTGMPNNAARLGIAFGCGNTFYGKDNASGVAMQFCSFTGAPSTAGSRTAAYSLLDLLGNNNIGPIGVDIANQRVMGDTTIGGTVPHSLSLFDLDQLSTTSANSPIDSKSYATSSGSAGTGAVDFTPDGTRVYALDTGNGIIAFNLAPKLAAPTICSQPRDFIRSNIVGTVAFFGVQPIGAPLTYQWLKNGAPIGGATNRTLDIYNVQTTDFAQYSVRVTNAMGSVTSSNVILDELITFSTPPSDQITPVGGSATFNVAVAGGLPAFSYQWKKNGGNVSGATTSSLTITNAQVSDAGGYTVAVTDSLGQVVVSPVASLTVGTLGSGTGLRGEYYTGQTNFAGYPPLVRIDPVIDFSFGTGSPDPSISADLFSIRWTGKVQPLYSQTYTFYVTSDDGSRLWVNGQLLINKWKNQAPTESSGTIALTAGQQYDVVLEYYENASSASVSMSWASVGQVKQIIPQTQLYPSASLTPNHPLLSSTSGGGPQTFTWAGSYTLQSATNVEGPYLDISGATSPYTNALTSDPQRYFRLISK